MDKSLTDLSRKCADAPKFGLNGRELILQTALALKDEDDFEFGSLQDKARSAAGPASTKKASPVDAARAQQLFDALPVSERPMVEFINRNPKVPRVTRQNVLNRLLGQYIAIQLQKKGHHKPQAAHVNKYPGLRQLAVSAAVAHERDLYKKSGSKQVYLNIASRSSASSSYLQTKSQQEMKSQDEPAAKGAAEEDAEEGAEQVAETGASDVPQLPADHSDKGQQDQVKGSSEEGTREQQGSDLSDGVGSDAAESSGIRSRESGGVQATEGVSNQQQPEVGGRGNTTEDSGPVGTTLPPSPPPDQPPESPKPLPPAAPPAPSNAPNPAPKRPLPNPPDDPPAIRLPPKKAKLYRSISWETMEPTATFPSSTLPTEEPTTRLAPSTTVTTSLDFPSCEPHTRTPAVPSSTNAPSDHRPPTAMGDHIRTTTADRHGDDGLQHLHRIGDTASHDTAYENIDSYAASPAIGTQSNTLGGSIEHCSGAGTASIPAADSEKGTRGRPPESGLTGGLPTADAVEAALGQADAVGKLAVGNACSPKETECDPARSAATAVVDAATSGRLDCRMNDVAYPVVPRVPTADPGAPRPEDTTERHASTSGGDSAEDSGSGSAAVPGTQADQPTGNARRTNQQELKRPPSDLTTTTTTTSTVTNLPTLPPAMLNQRLGKDSNESRQSGARAGPLVPLEGAPRQDFQCSTEPRQRPSVSPSSNTPEVAAADSHDNQMRSNESSVVDRADSSQVDSQPQKGSGGSSNAKVRDQVVAFIKAYLDPFYRAQVVTKAEYKAIVTKSSDKVMRNRRTATSVMFLVHEGDNVRKLVQQYMEYVKAKGV